MEKHGSNRAKIRMSLWFAIYDAIFIMDLEAKMNTQFIDKSKTGGNGDSSAERSENYENKGSEQLDQNAYAVDDETPDAEEDNIGTETEDRVEGWRDGESKAVEDKIEEQRSEVKVAVDWVELEAALENNSPELHSFLNTVTGDVNRIFESADNAELRLKQAEDSAELVYIDPISSREQYRWMEEFIETVEEPTLKDKLNIAIDGKGAFRRFKDVLIGYPAERESWFEKRSIRLRDHMIGWLESKNITPTNTPPWEGGEEATRSRSAHISRMKREGQEDLRALAHESLDLVPSRELPAAVAFLDFLRSYRGVKRSRFG